jgi:2-polyprenyl-3-methyl-5-hydroxy-6-metoxy-1,4-benzoquinol methylase
VALTKNGSVCCWKNKIHLEGDSLISERNQHEIEHGRMLASKGAESIWGWESPAGKVRAQRRARLILSRIPSGNKQSYLEIGCGTGDFTRSFSQSGASITAVDISEDLTTIARKNLSANTNVDVITSSFEDLPKDVKFDAVIGSSVLHHLDIQPALAQIFQLLKPNGVLSFAEPNMLNPQIMIQKNIPWIKKKMGDSPDETAFFSWQMSLYLETAGFSDIQVTPFDWLHPLIPPSLITTISIIGSVFEKIPVVKEFAGSLLISARKGSD